MSANTNRVEKMGFQLEEALGIEIITEHYSATVDVPGSVKAELVEHIKEEPSMSITHERESFYTITHSYE